MIRKEEKNMKKNQKNMNGITLIALVITIIVLLLLAGVSIAMLTGENGILTQATNANEKTKKASEKEREDLLYLELEIAKVSGKKMDDFLNEKVKEGEVLNSEKEEIKLAILARKYVYGNENNIDQFMTENNVNVEKEDKELFKQKIEEVKSEILPDKEGNIEDTVEPTIEFTNNSPETTANAYTTIQVTDDNSGVKEIKYIWVDGYSNNIQSNDDVWETATLIENGEVIRKSFSTNEIKQLYIRAEDNSGNVSVNWHLFRGQLGGGPN